MILQFSVSNYRSFRGLQTLNFAASNYDKSLPENLISPDLPGLKGKRWVKAVAIYGPNASGKSTFIEALQTLAQLVATSAKTDDPHEPIKLIEPYGLSPDAGNIPTAFDLVFVNDRVRYEYRLAATCERVWHESLRAFPGGKEQQWFSRDWQPKANAYQWTPENPTGFKRDRGREEYTLRNNLFLSKAIGLGDTQLEPVFRWFKERLKFLDLSARTKRGGNARPKGVGSAFTAKQIANNSALAPAIFELLRHADLGITDAKVTAEKPNADLLGKLSRMLNPEMQEGIKDTMIHKIELLHSGRDSISLPLPWESESAGTHRFFGLAGPWLDILQQGYSVCIDEIETSMHPLMVNALLRLLFDAESISGAQAIFTTHNPLLLDPTLLRRDQIWFTDKDEKGESHLYPLTDYQPRQGESLVRGYMAGRYGAVPFIPEGLLGRSKIPKEKGNLQ